MTIKLIIPLLLLIGLSLQATAAEDAVIRLKGGRFFNEGYLQIFTESGWGSVCDLDGASFSKREGDFVCRYLGFESGSFGISLGETDIGLLPSQSQTVTESFECDDGVENFSQCRIKYRLDCPQNYTVGLRCKVQSKSACMTGYTPALGNCYSLLQEVRSFSEASQHCKVNGGDLVEVKNFRENLILGMMMEQLEELEEQQQEQPEQLPSFTYWTGGIVSQILEANFKIWHGSQMQMDFDNNLNTSAAVHIPQGVVLTATNSLSSPDWRTVDLESKHRYICQNRQEQIGCLNEEDPHGKQYQGPASHDIEGQSCIAWSAAGLDSSHLAANWTHNFCRNPDEDDAPYCYIDNSGQPSYCNIPSCAIDTAPLSAPAPPIVCPNNPKKSALPGFGSGCPVEEWQCQDGSCISKDYVCDGSRDCSQGEDEQMCRRLSTLFVKEEGFKLEGALEESGGETVKASEEECAKLCLYKKFDKNGFCTSFSHKPGLEAKDDRCILGTVYTNQAFDSLVEKKAWNYYYLNSTEKKRRGLETSLPIDGLRARRGKKGGSQFGSKLEVKIGGNWGSICDSGFTMSEGEVVCKQLGYHLGIKEVVKKLGNRNGEVISLNGLSCSGMENSIAECSLDSTSGAECSPDQAVGVICKETMKECGDDEFHCNSGECIGIDNLCDGLTENGCRDGSDEDLIHCGTPTQVRLVGGENFHSGRLEIRHKGIWGTVCEDHFTEREASVFCRMLGYDGNATWSEVSTIKKMKGSWPIWIRLPEESGCSGDELSIEDCHERELWQHDYDCSHYEDVALTCQDSGDAEDPVVDVVLLDAEEAVKRRAEFQSRQIVENCGLRRPPIKFPTQENIPRIAGGRSAQHGSVPWQASIRLRGPSGETFHHCGGVIISPFHILTTAHCLWDFRTNLQIYYVRVGDNVIEMPDPEEQEFPIEKIDFHELFNVGPYLNNDIAIAHINKSSGGIKFGGYVGPACLPSPSLAYNNLNLTISGWGKNGYDQSHAGVNFVSRLQEASVPVIPPSVCKEDRIYGEEKISQGMFCAGLLEGGVDTCQGDSGGPAVLFDSAGGEERGVVAGLTSWGYGCGRQLKPGVYTRVSKYVSWIYERVRDQN